MKKILLISNYVFHYRIKIYNYFTEEFKKRGYEFHVLSNEYQKCKYNVEFIKHERNFSIKGYIEEIDKINPDVVINFLHLKDKLIIPLTYYCKFRKIPMIYWNHGVNLRDPENTVKNFIFRFVHDISDSIILYTPNELKYIKTRNRKKTFIAYNTLNFTDIDKSSLDSKEKIKKKYGINEKKVVIYISRIMPYKKLDVLIKHFKGNKDIGVIIVGKGISREQVNIIESYNNLYYLGEMYDKDVWEIFSIGDIYSTPGHIGLGLNEAFYWGKPVVVLEGNHAPEVFYLEDGRNGFKVKDEEELVSKILYLLNNEEIYYKFSNYAKETYINKCDISNMFNGFINAIEYCLAKR